MSKQILPHELANIVTGLLVCPDKLGEIDDSCTYLRFFREIGEVVASYCGGEISGASMPDQPEKLEYGCSAHLPMLAVYPSDSLPDHCSCVWAPYDIPGWEDQEAEYIPAAELVRAHAEVGAIAHERMVEFSPELMESLDAGEKRCEIFLFDADGNTQKHAAGIDSDGTFFETGALSGSAELTGHTDRALLWTSEQSHTLTGGQWRTLDENGALRNYLEKVVFGDMMPDEYFDALGEYLEAPTLNA